jgi:DNA adenine methylase
MNPVAAPITPWTGSKRGRKLDAVVEMVPSHFEKFFDAFVGGGSVALRLGAPLARIGDANPELVNVYSVLKGGGHGGLAEALGALSARMTPADYYEIRGGAVPEDPVARAARFLYLVRLAHGNLFRTNRSGRFNTSYGNRPGKLCNPANLALAAAYLASPGVEVVAGDYSATVADAAAGDFCYLDPPYVGCGFAQYTAEPFDHARFGDTVLALDERGVKVLVSNSSDPEFRALFSDAIADGRFRIKDVATFRGFRTAQATDAMLWNYDVHGV